MAEKYIISIDQSTQGTKALLLDAKANILRREDICHRQIVSDEGWVSHDAKEIYENTIAVVRRLVEQSQIAPENVCGVGISNQRETCLAWNKMTGQPIADAIVWQCSRAKDICARLEEQGIGEMIEDRTGLKLSPYFPASKLSWLLEYVEGAKELAQSGQLCMGTMDAWLVYCLTGKNEYKTDYSNASRTQLFNIHTLEWDTEICGLFGIDAALYAQGCLKPGMTKATYGTGSSIMMNTGETAIKSTHGVVTSLAWKIEGKVNYVLEGNINYTGAVITWLKNDVKLISLPGETETLCEIAAQDDELYLVPAFSGLGAPYWNSQAKGILSGITRTTGREEIVRAGVESIAYQIADVVDAMSQDAGMSARKLRVDGGPTRNAYLMQFQSDILNADVDVSKAEEMSALGAAYVAGIAMGLYDKGIAKRMERTTYLPQMEPERRKKKRDGWIAAVGQCTGK